MNIVSFEEAISRNASAAFAVRTRVRQENSITLLHKHGSESGHTFAIVSDAMQHKYIPAIVVLRSYVPGPQDSSIFRGYLHILHTSMELVADNLDNFLPVLQWTAMKMKLQFGKADAAD